MSDLTTLSNTVNTNKSAADQTASDLSTLTATVGTNLTNTNTALAGKADATATTTALNTLTSNLNTTNSNLSTVTSDLGTLTTTVGTNLTNTNTALAGKEDLSNKSTNVVTDGGSNTKYPGVKAIKDYVDATVGSATPDATATATGKIQLSGDLGGTATSPTVPGLANKADATATTNALNTLTTNLGTTNTNLNTVTNNLASLTTLVGTKADAAATTTSLNALLVKANNLSDLTNAGNARTNLGLGTAATSAITDFASASHIHANATTSVPGFMSATDKTKLDGLSNFTLPTADANTLGAVKIGAGITNTAGVISVSTNYEAPITAGTTSQYWRGDKSWQALNASSVGLGNVDNTSDANKPISTLTQTALNLKEDASNKSNAAIGTSTTLFPTQNAVKTYVDAQVLAGATPSATTTALGKIQLAGDLTGTATVPVVAAGAIDNSKISATAAIVDSKLATISTSGKVLNSATTATNFNTTNAIVARDASGNFSAGTITATLSGNATSATTATNLSNGTAGSIPYQTAAGSTSMSLGSVTNGQVLTLQSGVPTWATPSSSGTVTNVSALTLGTAGTDINSTVATSTSTPVITLNIPDASSTARGVINTGAQIFAGVKTHTSSLTGSLGADITGGAINLNASSNFNTNINSGSSTGIVSIGNSATTGLNFATGSAVNAVTTLGTSGSQVFASSTTGADKIAILPQSTTTTNSFTGSITSEDLTSARTWTLSDVSGTIALLNNNSTQFNPSTFTTTTAQAAISKAAAGTTSTPILGNITGTSQVTGTFIVPSGVKYITLEVVGGSGGGGGSGYVSSGGTARVSGAGGGGGGGEFAGEVYKVNGGDIVTYSIGYSGAGGAGGIATSTSATAGTAGGSTSVFINGTQVLWAKGGGGGAQGNNAQNPTNNAQCGIGGAAGTTASNASINHSNGIAGLPVSASATATAGTGGNAGAILTTFGAISVGGAGGAGVSANSNTNGNAGNAGSPGAIVISYSGGGFAN